MNQIAEPIGQYYVYIDVFNTKLWSNFENQFLIEVTIFDPNEAQEQKTEKQDQKECGDGMEPGFEQQQPDEQIQLDFSQNLTVHYDLP